MKWSTFLDHMAFGDGKKFTLSSPRLQDTSKNILMITFLDILVILFPQLDRVNGGRKDRQFSRKDQVLSFGGGWSF